MSSVRTRGSGDPISSDFQLKLYKTKSSMKVDKNDVKVLFMIFDRDKDGKLTSDELKSQGKSEIRDSGVQDRKTCIELESMYNRLIRQLQRSERSGRTVRATEGNVLNFLS